MTRRSLPNLRPYGIELHQHRFAAWAASRAASVKGCRFTVEQGRKMLELSGFAEGFASPDQLPKASAIDVAHRRWRAAIIKAGLKVGAGSELTHGVAAKLLNVYLKSRFVCGGCHGSERVAALHPPIDSVLLKALAAADVGGNAAEWKRAAKIRWSRFNSAEYEVVIAAIRQSLNGRPLWAIEEYWKGNQ